MVPGRCAGDHRAGRRRLGARRARSSIRRSPSRRRRAGTPPRSAPCWASPIPGAGTRPLRSDHEGRRRRVLARTAARSWADRRAQDMLERRLRLAEDRAGSLRIAASPPRADQASPWRRLSMQTLTQPDALLLRSLSETLSLRQAARSGAAGWLRGRPAAARLADDRRGLQGRRRARFRSAARPASSGGRAPRRRTRRAGLTPAGGEQPTAAAIPTFEGAAAPLEGRRPHPQG